MLLRSLSFLLLLTAMVSFADAQDCGPPSPGPRSLLKQGEVIFSGTLENKTGDSSRFRVTEVFKGELGKDIQLLPSLPGISKSMEPGESYLVFAETMPLPDGRHYYAHGCSLTRPLKYAQALVRQLRAEKAGKRLASVYGMLWQRTDYISGFWDPSLDHPLPGIVIRLRSNDRIFQTRTDEDGVYAFEDLPPGRYQASADLSAGLTLAGEYFEDPIPAFQLPGRSSYDYELTALPTGRIRGYVVGPDGKPLRLTSVELCRAGEIGPEGQYLFASQTDGRSFEFHHLPPGDYILVFNRHNVPSPDAPFARTFYGDALEVQGARTIHLLDGQQITSADIHVKDPIATRQITVRLSWGEKEPADYTPPNVLVSPAGIESPYPFKMKRNIYTLNLFLDKRYSIHAEVICRIGDKHKIDTNTVTVDGRDLSTSEVTLTFFGANCLRD